MNLPEKKSQALFELSKKRLPGGVNSPVRAFKSVNRNPRFIKKALRDIVIDVDGNSYIDYVNSWGPNILGHAYPEVIEAVKEACSNGLTFGAPTEKEYELAELVHSVNPVMEMMRLVCSGTEATMSAIRLARGYTGRDLIIKFRGCYHGHADGLLVEAGSGALTTSVPNSAGVPKEYTECTLVAEYNNLLEVEALFSEYENKIAGVIVEPVAANMGVVLPNNDFLTGLRNITRKNGALLIFDEVITGFRLSLGGASEYFGVVPDLITYGKIIGGGMPVGAYGGSKEIMSKVSPVGNVYQAGTLAGNPIATTAGITTIKILKNNPLIYKKIADDAKLLADAYIESMGNIVKVNRIGSLLCPFFTTKEVINYQTAQKSDTKKFTKYFNYMLDSGIYIAPSQFEAMFVSNALTKEHLEYTIDTIKDISSRI
ncbi:MAG: glutamate-1-semialdehyde 2,1-aminomutase [Succinivibrionaceae bacterium]